MKTVFLGGTCNGSDWRDTIIKGLNGCDYDLFNPVVDDWNEEAQKLELQKRVEADYVVYVITPEFTGCYAIAELVEDAIKQPSKTLVAFSDGYSGLFFTPEQTRSLQAVAGLLTRNSTHVFYDLELLILHMQILNG